MRTFALVFPMIFLASLGCGSTSSDGTCVSAIPDGGPIACDVGWACNDGMTVYELACASESGAYKCSCFVDGVASKTFSVSPFDCTAQSAQNTATAGCGWTITTEQ